MFSTNAFLILLSPFVLKAEDAQVQKKEFHLVSHAEEGAVLARPFTVRSAWQIQYYRRTIHGKGGECICWSLEARGKKSDYVHCLYAFRWYNGMAFTPWVTLPGENSRRTSPIPPRVTTPPR
ncbi:hypothetical protein AVEN_48577-1 [Araneus ventricosus]|uniref:Uncharacterized protein n=1 Tax=Araneus ventricosus TaxID=182803 RepID=A0A4Y2HF21_ARAVE|nr:hypothetical protein AVEN_48577-1 [Araneus ventricosus]